MPNPSLSSRLPGLSDSLPDLVASLLLQDHDLEPVKVVELPSLVVGGDLLGERGVIPLFSYLLLLPNLGNLCGTGAARQVGNDDAGQGDVGERERLAGDACVGGVNQDLYSTLVRFRRCAAGGRGDVPACDQ